MTWMLRKFHMAIDEQLNIFLQKQNILAILANKKHRFYNYIEATHAYLSETVHFTLLIDYNGRLG